MTAVSNDFETVRHVSGHESCDNPTYYGEIKYHAPSNPAEVISISDVTVMADESQYCSCT